MKIEGDHRSVRERQGGEGWMWVLREGGCVAESGEIEQRRRGSAGGEEGQGERAAPPVR